MNPAVKVAESPINSDSVFRLILEDMSNSDNEDVV